MKLTPILTTVVLASAATTAWGHPGHGAEGIWHHVVDLLAIGGIAAVLAIMLAGRKKGGKDND